MRKKPSVTLKKSVPLEAQFAEISAMILSARKKAFQKIDVVLVELYWNIGEYISHRVKSAEWGEGTVGKLAEYLEKTIPDSKGFNRRGLYRMKQFYEAYSGNPKVSPLVTQIQWSNHLIILSGTKTIEEKEFYLQVSAREKYSKRELERQIQNGLFERSLLSKPKVSPVATQIHPTISNIIRDSYSLDFLGLPDNHSEYDLRKGIVRSLKNFIIEFGRDFAFLHDQAARQAALAG